MIHRNQSAGCFSSLWIVFLIFLIANDARNANATPVHHGRRKHREGHRTSKVLESSENRDATSTEDLAHAIISSLPDSEEDTDDDVKYKLQHRHHIKRHPLLFDWTTSSCGVCNPARCEEPPINCASGLIRDSCDCCYVCGNLEDSPCDLPGEPFRFGECGRGLMCSIVPPAVGSSREASTYCTCVSTTVICGSDGRTYSNPCRFKRASGRNSSLQRSHEGPCLAAPSVEIPPMNQTAEHGSTAVFSCSVSGYPFSWFEWLKDGQNIFQPGLSDGIATQIRSGPLKYQVTTWMEIESITTSHSGAYTCVAKNQYGTANATARLEVLRGDYQRSNRYIYLGKSYAFVETPTETEEQLSASKKLYASTYLRSHTLPDADESLALHQRGRNINGASTNIDVQYDLIDVEERNTTEGAKLGKMNDQTDGDKTVDNSVENLLVYALENLIKPKEFKDIFFDDDDLSDGSGHSD